MDYQLYVGNLIYPDGRFGNGMKISVPAHEDMDAAAAAWAETYLEMRAGDKAVVEIRPDRNRQFVKRFEVTAVQNIVYQVAYQAEIAKEAE